jgi:hypothetical protein
MANKVSFEEFSKNTSLLKTSKGWDEDGDAIVDITLKSKPNSNFDFKYSVKNVKIDDYLTDRRLNFPIQIKEHIYNKFYKETKMSKGGKIKNQYEDRTASDIWDNLSKTQKQHFIYDHLSEIEEYMGKELKSGETIKAFNSDYNELHKDIKNRFENHVREGQYAKGGKVKSTFDEKVKAISKRLVGQKVPKKYKKEYGATYDKAEAKQAGRRIAGSQLVKLKEKMEKMRKAKKKS